MTLRDITHLSIYDNHCIFSHASTAQEKYKREICMWIAEASNLSRHNRQIRNRDKAKESDGIKSPSEHYNRTGPVTGYSKVLQRLTTHLQKVRGLEKGARKAIFRTSRNNSCTSTHGPAHVFRRFGQIQSGSKIGHSGPPSKKLLV